MSRALVAQQLNTGPVVGRPGERPDPRATGINANARRELDKYANDARQRVLDVVDRKRGVASSVNSWSPGSAGGKVYPA